jgi:hypothetical protein
MTRRRYESSQSRHTRAMRALGGVRIAERAEQLRACGVASARVAELLEVPGAVLAAYYALQDEMAGAA